MNDRMDEQMCGCTAQWLHGWMPQCVSQWMDEKKIKHVYHDRQLNGCGNEQIDLWVCGSVNWSMDGRKNEPMD